MSMPTTSHSFSSTLWGIVFPAAVYSGIPDRSNSDVLHFLYWHYYYGVMQRQPCHLDSQMVACSWLNICICNWEGIILCLPFMATSSIMANPCLMGQYFCMCHIICFVQPSLFDIFPVVLQMCIFGCCFLCILCGCTQWQVHCCVDSIDIYT